METVSSRFGSSTSTGWNRRASAASFSMYYPKKTATTDPKHERGAGRRGKKGVSPGASSLVIDRC
jgi:hypothetical protein